MLHVSKYKLGLSSLHSSGAKGCTKVFGKCKTDNNYYAKERLRESLKKQKEKLSLCNLKLV